MTFAVKDDHRGNIAQAIADLLAADDWIVLVDGPAERQPITGQGPPIEPLTRTTAPACQCCAPGPPSWARNAEPIGTTPCQTPAPSSSAFWWA